MKLAELAIATILLILFIVKLIKGKKYEEYTKQLTGSDYPLSELYTVGYAWNESKLFCLRGKLKLTLIKQARLLYDPNYAEFYTVSVWAQIMTFAHLFLCAGFILAGATDFTIFAFAAVIFAVIISYYFFSAMGKKLEERRTACVIELPEVVSTMALLINSGMILREAWGKIAESKEGEIYALMRNANVDMHNGMSEIDALHKFGVMSDTPEIKKFSSALVQGIEKGSRELSNTLVKQSSEMWNIKKQTMLQKGEAASAKLLAPTAMIFVGVLVIIIAAAMGMLL